MIIPKQKHALISITKHMLKIIDEDITQEHVDLLKTLVHEELNSGLTPKDIKCKYGIKYSDFGMFIKTSLGIKLKTRREAAINYCKNTGKTLRDDKYVYKAACEFKFNPADYPMIHGYDQFTKLGIYHPLTNPNGMCRDHIISKQYGYEHSIPPDIIASPANCQYLTNEENCSKGSVSGMTLDDLLKRIESGVYAKTNYVGIKLPRTPEHNKKIREANLPYMMITNGMENLRVLKSTDIPHGYRKGLTRKSKMVGQPGLEPGSEIF